MTVSANDVLLSVAGLEGGYDQVQILWGVDLEVSAGEMVAIIGSNGAGKTTFLKTISGIVRSRAGSIVFDGIALESATAKEIVERGISHVPEGRRLFGALNIEENLLMGGYARGLNDRALAADLERVYGIFPILKDRRKQLASSMSGGEQQMCAIARGLMAKPRLLLIDELSLGLAPLLVEELCANLIEINRDGVAILLVEQDVLTALNLAERGYVFESGRIAMSGTSDELIANQEVRRAYLGI
ncbi:MAG: ABC transporter ATP-binding protein [Rhodospirillales bacterium]|jgi:branched-chain amino acid transport system ATP-binding protein